MARLSVNLNKIALLRNARTTGVPKLAPFVERVHAAGARGITVHPRSDERHIRRSDVAELAALIAPWRPAFEYNIEGYPDARFVETVSPEQVTLVPDPPGVLTSDEGWKLDSAQTELVAEAVARLHRMGSRVILFVDPDPAVVTRVAPTGADGIEIYTGSYAHAFNKGAEGPLLAACAELARRAGEAGLVVNIGHDLNLANLPPLLAAAPNVAEASIGHELTADALMMGWDAAVAAYRDVLAGTARMPTATM
jgi:pyridoxine 5-phosphate synthase